MKALKYIAIGISVLVLIFVSSGFILYMSWTSPPMATFKISGEGWNLNSEFHEGNLDFWKKEGDKLVFNNQTSEKELMTLHSNALPSEHKKQGYITTKLLVSSDFDTMPDDCILGIQIGEKNADEKEQLVFGINGKGELIALDGNLDPLEGEKISFVKNLKGNCCSETELSLHYYRNPRGWIVFFGAKNEQESTGFSINHIPFDKLNSENKALSLLAFNPSQKGKIWFKDWEIQNDWTPND